MSRTNTKNKTCQCDRCRDRRDLIERARRAAKELIVCAACAEVISHHGADWLIELLSLGDA